MILTLIAVGTLLVGIIGYLICDREGFMVPFIVGLFFSFIFTAIIIIKPIDANRAINRYKATQIVLDSELVKNNHYIVNDVVDINANILDSRHYLKSPFVSWFVSSRIAELELLEVSE